VTLILILAVSLCVGAGVLLILSRDVFRIVVGFTVLGSAVNLILFLGGRPGTLVPPVILPGAETLAADAASPLPQALALTAIVIGFALLCFGLVLAARVSRDQGGSDVARHQASEPPSDPAAEDPLRPPVMEQD
jgi:multicomponent Na+:H+ antiporter subunit C